MTDNPTMTSEPLSGLHLNAGTVELNALAVVWNRAEPARVGEVLLIPPEPAGRAWSFGRGESSVGVAPGQLELLRQRPGRLEPTHPLQSPRISRSQLQIRTNALGSIEVENVGRCPMLCNGHERTNAELHPGDVIELRNEMVLLCLKRPGVLPTVGAGLSVQLHPFGAADSLGLVGESPPMWELRRQIAFIAPRQTHVLILGASGTGKELVARAIHSLSPRHHKAMVSRNAATFPETLIDAELFGNAKNYPNSGMPERPGLVGEANGSTLFLDEIGELPSALQAHLLRVLDQGEYQRLGESTVRHSDLRLIGATNRPESHLKHDVLARMGTRLELPDLNSRREDIPLIARYLLRRIATRDPDIAQRYFNNSGPAPEPRITPAFMVALVQHQYTTHVRELESLLWQAMSSSPGNYLDVTGVRFEKAVPPPSEARREVDGSEIPPEVIQECLDRHNGVQNRVWQELGLPNRFVLHRLIKKYKLVVRRSEGGEDSDDTSSTTVETG